jgi:chromosomal replication initiation ATPase DnaA
MGEPITGRVRRPRHLLPQSRARIDRLRSDPAAFALVEHIAAIRGVALRELLRGGQNRGHLGLSRQLAMYLVHVLLSRSQQDVAVLFSRANTTVSYACRVIELRRDDPAFEAQIADIEADGWEVRHAA